MENERINKHISERVNGHMQLVIAYVVIPLIWCWTSNMRYGDSKLGFAFVLFATFCGGLVTLLPATIFRFFLIRRSLKYGLELFLAMIMCMIISIVLTHEFWGGWVSVSWLDAIAIYLILSYKAVGKQQLSMLLKIFIVFVTILAFSFYSVFVENSTGQNRQLTSAGVWISFCALFYNKKDRESDVKNE